MCFGAAWMIWHFFFCKMKLISRISICFSGRKRNSLQFEYIFNTFLTSMAWIVGYVFWMCCWSLTSSIGTGHDPWRTHLRQCWSLEGCSGWTWTIWEPFNRFYRGKCPACLLLAWVDHILINKIPMANTFLPFLRSLVLLCVVYYQSDCVAFNT